jgi:type II secretory pathway pseudopilin PulG
MIPTKQKSGFALLMTLVVVTAVVSITLAIIELSIKQLSLTVTARDSELAFQAANAGIECIRYLHRQASTTFTTPLPTSVPYTCFQRPSDTLVTVANSFTVTGNGSIRRYRDTITWGPNNDRCSVLEMVLMHVDPSESSDLVVSNLNTAFPGYPSGQNKRCSPGSLCTIAEVTGFNKPCNAITTAGSVRREVLLEF